MLFCFRRFQDCGKRIAKVHGADFFTLCCPYFCFVPCPVVTHTAAYCQIGPMSFCIQTTNAKVMENDLLHLDVLKCLEYIFCDTLAAILKSAKAEQHKNRF